MTRRPSGASLAGQVLLGGDRPVQRIGYGVMQLLGPAGFGPPPDRPHAIHVLRRAAALGITYINSANAYGPHHANDLIAAALHPYGEIVIGNKIGPTRGADGSFGLDLRPESLRRALQEALRHLQLEVAELAILRADGDLPAKSAVPWEEAVSAMADLQQAGDIKRIGVSGVTLDQLRRARAIVRVDAVENRYNLWDRQAEAVLADCEAHGTMFTPYQPLNAGTLPAGGVLGALARRLEATPAQIALAWLLKRSSVIVCIPGTRSLAHLEENVGAAALAERLTDADVAALAQPAAFTPNGGE